MKVPVLILGLVLPVAHWGCSRNNDAGADAHGAAGTSSHPPFALVESAETKERNQIRSQTLALFTNKDYRGVEELGAKYRASKESYPNGTWKLGYVYTGLEPSDDAPEAAWSSRLVQIDEWIRARPESITARVAKSRILIGIAWEIRGSGSSDTVKEAQWKRFHQKLQEAAAVLTDAKRLRERCPLYWSSWQRVALGLQMDRKNYEAFFSQAVKEFPDYWFYYSVKATFLLPRWYGEPGDWEKDLTQSADRLGGESGDMVYAQVVFDISGYGDGQEMFASKRISWERVDRGLEALLRKFPDSLEVKSQRAVLATLACDRPKARAYFLQTEGEAALSVWRNQERLDRFAAWAFGK